VAEIPENLSIEQFLETDREQVHIHAAVLGY
jgi:hypothetical protein